MRQCSANCISSLPPLPVTGSCGERDRDGCSDRACPTRVYVASNAKYSSEEIAVEFPSDDHNRRGERLTQVSTLEAQGLFGTIASILTAAALRTTRRASS